MSYVINMNKLSWEGAQAAAAQNDGYLVEINDAAENSLLMDYLSALYAANSNKWSSAKDGGNSPYSWIGYSDAEEEGTWLTTSGDVPAFFNWGAAEPDNFESSLGDQDYGALALAAWPKGAEAGAESGLAGQWNDLNGNNELFSIYEIDSELDSISVTGSQKADQIYGTELADQIYGNGGNDKIFAYGGDDFIDGGTGNDNLSGGAGLNILVGGAGNDKIVGGDDGNTVYGDELTPAESNGNGNGGNNGNGAGVPGNDTIMTGSGDDVIDGGRGKDNIKAGAGNDLIDGGDGNDHMAGGAGDDTYFVDSAKDKISEKASEGNDTVVAAVDYTLGNNLETLLLAEEAGNIDGTGGKGNETVVGNSGNNMLSGGKGGSDILTGGEGRDSFVFDSKAKAGEFDTITDFVIGDDTIQLSLKAFDLPSGVSMADAFGSYIVYDSVSGALYYDADASGTGAAAVQIGVVGTDTHPSLSATDFAII